MKQFDTLLEAAEYAATLGSSWDFAYSQESYDKNGLLGIAEIHDDENPADEGSFYVVSSGGSIGFCPEGEDIDWLFLLSLFKEENLPLVFTSTFKARFCSKCGKPLAPDARFCGACGSQLG